MTPPVSFVGDVNFQVLKRLHGILNQVSVAGILHFLHTDEQPISLQWRAKDPPMPTTAGEPLVLKYPMYLPVHA